MKEGGRWLFGIHKLTELKEVESVLILPVNESLDTILPLGQTEKPLNKGANPSHVLFPEGHMPVCGGSPDFDVV